MNEAVLTNTAGRQAKDTRLRLVAAWTAVLLAALTLFAATANRGAQWQDSGEMILRIERGQLLNHLGLALTHTLHFWLARAALHLPFLEPAFSITLVSSLAAAAAVANVYGCVFSLVRRPGAALFAAASLAVANTFWHLATITEVYTLTAALLAAECWCLASFTKSGGRMAFVGMLLFNGLGVANHLQAGLTTPVLAVVAGYAFVSGRLRLRDLLIGLSAWVLGSLPYTSLVIAHAVRTGDLAATLRSAFFGAHFGSDVLNTSLSARMLGVSLAFVLFNFPNLLLPAAGYGLAVSRRVGIPRTARRALLAGLLVHALFVLRYSVPDQHTFFLPVYVLLCIFGGVGAAAVVDWPVRRRTVATVAAVITLYATPPVYWATVRMMKHYGLFRSQLHSKPYRDDYTYLFIPWSVVDRSADRMSREAVELAGDDGLIVIEDDMARFAVEYRARRDGKPKIDIRVCPPERPEKAAELMLRMAATLEVESTVVLVPKHVEEPATPPPPGCEWTREGELYVLDPLDDS